MTNQELDNAFKLYLNKVDSMGTLDFLPLERQRILNDALLWVAREICTGKSDSQDEVDMRVKLSTPWNATLVVTSGIATVTLPTNYLAYGRLAVRLKSPLQNYLVTPKMPSEAQLGSLLSDPFNRPTIGEPAICFTAGVVQAYPAASCDKLEGSYYRQPLLIVLANPTTAVDMAEAKIFEVLQKAVSLALESITDSRFQTQAAIATQVSTS